MQLLQSHVFLYLYSTFIQILPKKKNSFRFLDYSAVLSKHTFTESNITKNGTKKAKNVKVKNSKIRNI